MIAAPDIDPDTPSQSENLNAFIAGLPTDAEVVFPPDRDYRCDQTLTFDGKTAAVDLNGSLIHTDDTTGDGLPYGAPDQHREWAIRARDHFHLLHSNIELFNGSIRGAKPRDRETLGADYEAQHGIGLQNSTVTTHDLDITDVNGDGICFHRSPGDRSPSSGNVGPGTSIDRVGRSGVTFAVAQHVHVSKDVYVGHTARSTFDFEPLVKSWFVDDIIIDGPHIGNGRLLFIAATGPGPVDNVTVQNVRLDRPMNLKVGGVRDATGRSNRNHWDINNVVASDVWGTTGPAAPCVFIAVDGLVFAGNTQEIQRGRPNIYGIALTDCHGVVEYLNSFPGAVDAAWIRGTTNRDLQLLKNQTRFGGRYNMPSPAVDTRTPA